MSVRRRERRDLRRWRREMGHEIEQAVVAILAAMNGERFDVRAVVDGCGALVTIEHEGGSVCTGRVNLEYGQFRHDVATLVAFALSRSRPDYMRSRLAQMKAQMRGAFDEDV